MKSRAVLLVLVLVLLLPQVAAAQEEDPFPDTAYATVWTRINLVGQWSWLISGGVYWVVTDASWEYWNCGTGDRVVLYEIQGRGLYDAHCYP